MGVSLALMATTLSSCDLDTTPTTSLDSDAAFKTTTYAENVLRGAWSYAFNEGQTYQSIGIFSVLLSDDFMGSDCVKAKSYGYSQCYNLTVGYGRGQHNSVLWDICYDAINNCNNIIANIDKASGSDTDKSRIKGQAYATRGYMYMMLASHFAFSVEKDPNAVCVPIYTEPTDMNQALTGNPAASVKEVYDQTLADLKKSVELIPEKYNRGVNTTDYYKINHTVAMGILARTALYARDWQTAYDYASKVLEKNPYLMTEAEYKSGFNNCNNGEWLWGYSATQDDNDGAYTMNFKDKSLDGYGSLCVDPYFVENYHDNDYRKDLFQDWGYTAQGGKVVRLLNSKFAFQDIDNGITDMDLMRTSEMYLIKAEAAYYLHHTDEAKSVLYTLQQARMKEGKTAPEITATGEDLLKAIWLERRLELWGEGFAITDIIRNQQSIERKGFEGPVIIKEEDEEGNITTEDAIGTGHDVLKFNDGTDFCPNSKYYLYRIPLNEELQNQNLYKNHQKLDFYR